MTNDDNLYVSDCLYGCARCGKDHENLSFRRFALYPVEISDKEVMDYWAPCPTNGDPILLSRDETEQAPSEKKASPETP